MTPTSTLATIVDSFLQPLIDIIVFVLTNYWGYIVIFAIAASFIGFLLAKGKKISGGG